MHIRHGIDRLSIDRLARLYARRGPRGLARIFTDAELGSLIDGPAATLPETLPAPLLASLTARYCAKEAVAKALGTGIRAGVTLRSIEILSDGKGAPYVVFHGLTQILSDTLGITSTALSLTHEGGVAFASVVMLAE